MMQLWPIERIAEFASISETTARRIVYQPGFPGAIRVGNGHPRWPSDQVIAYFLAQQEAA